MARKSLFMLVLCTPFIWVAGAQGYRLYKLWNLPAPALVNDENDPPSDPPPGDLARIKKSAEAIVELPDDLVSTVVRLDDPPEAASSSGDLADTLMTMARARAVGRRVVEEARGKTVAAEEKIKALLDRPTDLAELERLLQEYAELEVHDPRLLDSARAQTAWVKLDHDYPRAALDRLYDNLDRWKPETPPTALSPSGDPGRAVAAYEAFLNSPGVTRGAPHESEARDRLILWDHGKRLVNLLSARKDRTEQIRDLVALTAKGTSHRRFEATARHLVGALCADLLRPKEKLDPIVLILSADSPKPEPFPRDRILIRWKDRKDDPPERFDESVYDEYTLPVEKVDSVDVPDGGNLLLSNNSKEPPLQATPYSKAIHAYNIQREKMRDWSVDELIQLRDVCIKHQAALENGGSGSSGRTLIARIEALLEISKSNPNLFVASTP
jgi:hypothetical protein